MTFSTLVCTYINGKPEHRMEMLFLRPTMVRSAHEIEVFLSLLMIACPDFWLLRTSQDAIPVLFLALLAWDNVYQCLGFCHPAILPHDLQPLEVFQM